MIYYIYDTKTLEFKNSIEAKEGRIPVNSTTKELPIHSTLQHCVFLKATEDWSVVSKKEFTELQIGLGNKTKTENQKVDENGEIVSMNIDELIEHDLIPKEVILKNKLNEISSKAKFKIESGFESKAKGQFYIYDSTLEDQFNIKTLLDLGQDTPVRCTKKSDGIKDYYPHTVAQLEQIVKDFTTYKTVILKKSHELKLKTNSIENLLELQNLEVIY